MIHHAEPPLYLKGLDAERIAGRQPFEDSPLWKLLQLKTAILAQDHTPSWSSWDQMT